TFGGQPAKYCVQRRSAYHGGKPIERAKSYVCVGQCVCCSEVQPMRAQPIRNLVFARGLIHGRQSSTRLLGYARCTDRSDSFQLSIAESCCTERQRSRLCRIQMAFELRRTALNCRCRIV